MIDIHNHMLFGVDDGADSLEESIKMLQNAKEQGITAIILTPHYRHGMFGYPVEDIMKHFRLLEGEANKIGIKLYLGTEYHVNSHIIENFEKRRCATLAKTRYILAEYSFESEFEYLYKTCQEMINHGYFPVIAHAERYECLAKDIDHIAQLRRLGAWIQVNADSVLGMDGRNLKKVCKKMLKNEYVDVVASDSHGITHRANHMQECKTYVEKKYGSKYAEQIFVNKQKELLASIAK